MVVVDESVLALTNYKLDDPISLFYADRETETTDFHSRENLKLAIDGAAGGGGGGRDYSVNANRMVMTETVNVTAAPARRGLFSAEYGDATRLVTKSGTKLTSCWSEAIPHGI